MQMQLIVVILEVGFAVSPSKLISILSAWLEQHTFDQNLLPVLPVSSALPLSSADEVFFAAVVACIVGIACTVGTVFVASRDDVFFAAAIVIAFWDGFLVVGVCGVACIVGTISCRRCLYRQHCRYNHPLRRCLYRRHCCYNPLSSDWMWLGIVSIVIIAVGVSMNIVFVVIY
jgi:hypothetical protein